MFDKSTYQKEWKAAHHEQILAYRRTYTKTARYKIWRAKWLSTHRLQVRLEVFSHYSEGIPKCACCAETTDDFLTLDHNGAPVLEGKLRGGIHLYEKLKKEGFPAGYQVLCMNCNYAKGVFGKCPHKGDA